METGTNNKIESLLKLYYSGIVRLQPEETEYRRSYSTIAYLVDCGIGYLEILEIVKNLSCRAITYECLPDSLWKGSLIKRGAFYLHKELVLVSPAPKVDFKTGCFKEYPFYYEVKIRYTAENVVDYFNSRISSEARMLAERKRNIGSVKYLIEEFSRFDYLQPLDILLVAIDKTVKIDPDVYSILTVKQNIQNTVRELTSAMLEMEATDKRKLVPRYV